jgi:hypothetical protein
MVKFRLLVGLCAVLAPVALAPTASADPTVGPPICSSAGTAISGVHNSNLTITGNSYVASGTTLTVRGNLQVAGGACLDAFTLGTVKVSGNVTVGKGAILALGCSPGSIGPVPPCGTTTTADTVGGNIIATQPLTMYLDGDTVRGNVISTGGGPGPTLNPYVNFPIKENLIDGNLTVSGWEGAWFGVLRNTVRGNVILEHNVGLTIGELGTPDSTEVVTNTISGNLICLANNPAAQVGDSGGSPNVVGGRKVGQCAAL